MLYIIVFLPLLDYSTSVLIPFCTQNAQAAAAHSKQDSRAYSRAAVRAETEAKRDCEPMKDKPPRRRKPYNETICFERLVLSPHRRYYLVQESLELLVVLAISIFSLLRLAQIF